jgi:hypothetical protein
MNIVLDKDKLLKEQDKIVILDTEDLIDVLF